MELNQLVISQAINASDFVQYASGSIVSKQLIKRKGGTMSLFAFDQGQSLSEHTAPYDALAQVIDGTAEFIIDKKLVVVKSGEFVILPANIAHSINAMKQFKMFLIMIKE